MGIGYYARGFSPARNGRKRPGASPVSFWRIRLIIEGARIRAPLGVLREPCRPVSYGGRATHSRRRLLVFRARHAIP